MHLERFALVGVVGTRVLSSAAWVWGGPAVNEGWLVHPGGNGGMAACVYGAHGSPVAGAQALDGVFMAGRRDALVSLGFDATTFDGFHFYDLDLSYRAHRAGLPVGICGDILLLHSSSGRFGQEYARYARRFLDKYPDLPLGPRHPDPNYVIHEVPDRLAVKALFGWLGHWHAST
jgi:GT2 family glycosyltransferase